LRRQKDGTAMTVHAPVSHHFNPQFYLGAWAGDDGKVTRYSRPYRDVVAKRVSPRGIGREDHLYSVQGMPPGQQAYIETHFFSPVDSKGAVAHQVLLAGGLNRLTPQQREDWTRFMMSMQNRNPFALQELRRLAEQVLRKNLDVNDSEYDAVRKDGDPATLWDWTMKHQPHVIEEAYKRMLPGIIDHKGVGQHMMNMFWATIDVSGSAHSLLTCDRPIFWTQGLKAPDTVLLFPLSPTVLFAATNGAGRMRGAMRAPPKQHVRVINDQIARLAVEFVIGKDDRQLSFVENRLPKSDQEPIPGIVGKGRPNCPV
jgi:hypothetical protein